MSVGFAAITGGIRHRSLEPGFGTTVVIAAVITARFFTLDVARRTVITARFFTTRFFTLDVASRTVIAAVVTTGAVLRAVGRCVSGFSADAAVLIEEGRANDFAVGTGLVFDEVVSVVGNRETGVVADLAERHIGRTDPSVRETASGF
jgi:hypothetical protein